MIDNIDAKKQNLKLFFTLALMLSLFNYAQSQKSYKLIIGKIIDSESGNPVMFANIRNITGDSGTITDSAGVFKMRLNSDTADIIISSVSYYTKKIKLQKDSIPVPFIIKMDYKIYEIMQVDVYPMTKAEFKYKFIYADIKKDSISRMLDNLKTKFNSVEELDKITPKAMIPLNFKSRKEKQEILLAKIKELSHLKSENKKRIIKVTGLKGRDVYDFENFCKFSYRFLKNASEYLIYKKIHDCYDKYKQQKQQKQ